MHGGTGYNTGARFVPWFWRRLVQNSSCEVWMKLAEQLKILEIHPNDNHPQVQFMYVPLQKDVAFYLMEFKFPLYQFMMLKICVLYAKESLPITTYLSIPSSSYSDDKRSK